MPGFFTGCCVGWAFGCLWIYFVTRWSLLVMAQKMNESLAKLEAAQNEKEDAIRRLERQRELNRNLIDTGDYHHARPRKTSPRPSATPTSNAPASRG